MSVIKSTNQVTINKSYIEKTEERTRSINIETEAGESPKILITREIVTYHDDVKISTTISKRFQITVEDLTAIGKLGIMQEIANTIDTIATTK